MIDYKTNQGNIPVRFEMSGTLEEIMDDLLILVNCVSSGLRRMDPEISSAFVGMLSSVLGDPHATPYTEEIPFPSVGAITQVEEP